MSFFFKAQAQLTEWLNRMKTKMDAIQSRIWG